MKYTTASPTTTSARNPKILPTTNAVALLFGLSLFSEPEGVGLEPELVVCPEKVGGCGDPVRVLVEVGEGLYVVTKFLEEGL